MCAFAFRAWSGREAVPAASLLMQFGVGSSGGCREEGRASRRRDLEARRRLDPRQPLQESASLPDRVLDRVADVSLVDSDHRARCRLDLVTDYGCFAKRL